jgi:hypothetical protein
LKGSQKESELVEYQPMLHKTDGYNSLPLTEGNIRLLTLSSAESFHSPIYNLLSLSYNIKKGELKVKSLGKGSSSNEIYLFSFQQDPTQSG